jgi:hypothetical protein
MGAMRNVYNTSVGRPERKSLLGDLDVGGPRVVTGEKNSPTVEHACRKRRLKWVLPQVGGWSTGLATLSL